MKLIDIPNIRLFSQKIERTEFKTAKEIVSWMGAMQAQDYLASKWAIGTRLLNSTETMVEDAINKGDVIRTHLMRPTWHFVSAEDIYWMLELTTPQIKSAMKSRHTSLELSNEVVSQGHRLIERALDSQKNLTREEIANLFATANIKTTENRLSHFLLLAELEGIICSGITVKTHGRASLPTYALLSERVPNKKILTREESLAELAKRYFLSHCPATIKDFSWWSGLSLTDARKGLEFVKGEFISEIIGDEKYWLTNSFPDKHDNQTSVHLLPSYDEFLISYKDRSASLSLTHNKKTVSDNGIFRPIIVVNGLVTGLWKCRTLKDKVSIEVDFFQPPDEALQKQVNSIISRYGSFINKEIKVK